VKRAARVAAKIGSRHLRKRDSDPVAEELNDIELAIGTAHRATRPSTTWRSSENSSLKMKRREGAIEHTDIQCIVRASDTADNRGCKTGPATGIGRDPGRVGDRDAAAYDACVAESLEDDGREGYDVRVLPGHGAAHGRLIISQPKLSVCGHCSAETPHISDVHARRVEYQRSPQVEVLECRPVDAVQSS
jgi:hypothetical protein